MNSRPSSLRITSISQDDESAELKIEGRVTAADVALLDGEIRAEFDRVERIVLNLEGLKHIDREGLEMLKGWSGDRLVLQGCSSFIRSLLAASGFSGSCD